MKASGLVIAIINISLIVGSNSLIYAQYTGLLSFTKANGLPDDNVTCMLTDSTGFNWIGTFNGLSRFDGTHFFTFPQGTLDSKKLAGDIILDLEEDGDFIWVAHRFGLSRINKYNFESTNFQNHENGLIYSHRRAIKDIYKDATGNLWLAGDHQLLKFDKKRNTIITLTDFEKILPKGSTIQLNKIVKGLNNELWLFVARNWLKFDCKKNKIDTTKITAISVSMLRGENVRLKSYWNSFVSNLYLQYNKKEQTITVSDTETSEGASKVMNLYVDSSGQVFVCQEQSGITIFNSKGSTNSQKNALFSFEKNLQPFNFIQYSNGIYYRGSVKGLHVEDSRAAYLQQYYFEKKASELQVSVPDILDVKEYNTDEWIICTKEGLYKINQQSKKVSNFEVWKDSTIYKAVVMPDKSIWLSTDKNLWHYYPHSQKKDNPISIEIYATSVLLYNYNLVVGTRSNGIVIVNTKKNLVKRLTANNVANPLQSNRITAIKPVDNAGNFIVTYNNLPGHFSYINIEKGMYRSDSIPSAAYSFKERFSLQAVNPGYNKLWLGNYLGGLHMYDSLTKSWTNFTMGTGLSSNTVSEILSDSFKRAWLLTDKGIDVYDGKKQRIYNFPIQFITGGKNGGFVNSTGKLIFFDRESISEIDPSGFNTKPLERRIVLSQIKYGGKQFLQRNAALKLPYNNSSFTISFSLQKLNADYQVNYAYRLTEKDNWKEIGKETQLNFVVLQPGKYNLQIKATDEYGQWSYYSEGFAITVSPPFWKKWWFTIAAFVGAFIVMRFFISRRQKQKMQKLYNENEIMRLKVEKEISVAKERERIITDLHDDIGATLSSMNIYGDLAKNVWAGQPEESKKMIDKISVTSKDLMNRMGDIIWSMKPADNEKYTLEARIKNYANELLAPKEVLVHFAIDQNLAATIKSPEIRKNILLIVKEAMNNIAKYSEATKATISFKISNGMAELIISDNGKGFETTAIQPGNGLANINNRCAVLKGSCIINNHSGKGVIITCNFPIAIISHT
jgi:signal transduction histidine kinase/ligand-binding sensor domain-containing protein